MYSIEIKGIDKVATMLAKFPKESAGNVNDAIRKSLISIQRDATMAAPTDTGKLKSDWDLSFGNLTGSLKNRSQYAKYMEFGTRPHFPPLDAIAPWANRHGIPPFLVARAISRKGTKAKRYFGNAVDKNKPIIQRFFDEAMERTVKAI